MTLMRNTLVYDHSHRQLHSFLDELKNGTQNYRTVSSLGEQVAQEYRGRCVIELMQNAHDALGKAPEGDPRLITLVLQQSPVPVLLAANSGTPFREEDFGGICKLGQSPKDPNVSVGNKGLGFRSVLEVSSCPEVWSIAPKDGVAPFQFAFNPNVLTRVADALESLQRLGMGARCPFLPSSNLVDWSAETLQSFREGFGPTVAELAAEVRNHLSPYQFPLDVGDMPAEVQALLDAGHKTVIRLPIDGGRNGKTEAAVRSILDQFTEIDSNAMVFLSHVRTLTLSIDGVPRTFVRQLSPDSTAIDALTDYQRIDVHEDTAGKEKSPPRVFHLWRRSIGTGKDSAGRKEIREAVRHLPNRWPEVSSATVGIATEETDAPSDGRFVIFLPTTVSTGTAAFINAPFFGSLDRRTINFGDPYNYLLWRYVVRFGLRIIRELVSKLDKARRAQVIVDIAGSTAAVPGLEKSVVDELLAASQEAGPALADELTVLCRNGWTEARKARSLFAVPDESGVPASAWKQYATFALLDDALLSRVDRVNALAGACGGSLVPSDAEIAATVGALAGAVQDRSVPISWQAFLESVVDILPEHLRTLKPQHPDPLRAVKFLPAQSGQLLRASDQTVLFFQPKRGADEGRDFAGDVPASIQNNVAFLHKDIVTQEGPQGRNTPVQKFLDTRFVREFSRDDILRRVVEPAIPKLPIAHKADEATLCADLLEWTLRILSNDVPQSLAGVLQKLPVPCFGGWYPMREATFGPGWSGHLGEELKVLAEALPKPEGEALLAKALMPPSDANWSGMMPRRVDALIAGGVVDGLRLQLAEELGWAGTFAMAGGGQHRLPATPPPGFSQDIWESWRQVVRNDAKPRYEGYFSYRLNKVYVLRELAHVGTLTGSASRALSELLLASFPHWPEGWNSVELQKTERMSWTVRLKSPLLHALRVLGWFADGEQSRSRPLSKRWLVREVLLGSQRERFSHLRPLPASIARRLTADSELLRQLTALGLNTFPIDEEKIGPQLLDALATAWEKKRNPPLRLDVFVGQVRDGWRHFDPSRPLPQRFVISAGRRSLRTCTATELGSVYLPDSSERVRTLIEHGKFVLEMRGDDAHRLASILTTATQIRRASRLRERALIDGIEWDDKYPGGDPIVSSPYAWLPPVLLVVAAFGGATSAGSTTKAWNEAAERLRRARVVECERISLELWDEETTVASSEPAALWLGGEVLALCRRVQSDYGLLAEALQASLGRQDLIRTLRLIFRELNGKVPPSNEDIERALGFAEIDAQSLADIRHRWTGSISLLVDRLRPVLAVLNVAGDGLENALSDESQLAAWLVANVQQWDAADLLQAARRSTDDVAMGRRAHEVLGDVAELPRWNAALGHLGERYVAVRNEEAQVQAQAHKQDVLVDLRALIREIAIVEGRPERFVELDKVVSEVTFPTAWADVWWRVPLRAVCTVVADALAAVSVAETACAPLRTATGTHQLREQLQAGGVDLGVRPYDLAANNLQQFKAVLTVVHDVHNAWLAAHGTSNSSEMPDAEKSFPPSWYIDQWDEASFVGRSLALLEDTQFTAACQGCARAADLRTHLNLTEDDIEKRRQERQKAVAEAARKKRTFQVAGGAFEVGKDDYGTLLGRLREAVSLNGAPDVKTDTFTAMAQPGQGHRSGGGGGGFGKSSHLRPSAEIRELVGIVGEMHAYHLLRVRFGEEIVTREAWVSETRLKVLPPVPGEGDKCSDGYGWDFQFRTLGKEWRIEVKASASDDEEFEMGITEIQAASRLAGSKTELWRILRVRDVFSASPKFDWLPNPFEAEHRGLYRIDQSGARVKYTRKRG